MLATLGIVAAAWECWTLVEKEKGQSFSATLRKLGRAQPFIPMMSGALMRHLWDCDETRAAYHAGYAAGGFWPLHDGED